MIFEASGADDDLREAHRHRQVADRRATAELLMDAAHKKVEESSDGEGIDEAERSARDALGFFARSLDWAEDSPEEGEAHRLMDEAGAWVCQTFRCRLKRLCASYEQTCPVALAHNRIGFSIGGVARRTCSLCGGDFSECDHMPGMAYLVPGGHDQLGWCRVCLKETCGHLPSVQYRVSVVAIICEMNIDEVSLVGKPAQPEACPAGSPPSRKPASCL